MDFNPNSNLLTYHFVFSNVFNASSFIVHTHELLKYTTEDKIPFDEFFEFYTSHLKTFNS